MMELKHKRIWIPWLRNYEGRKIPSLDGSYAKWSDRSILVSYNEALLLEYNSPRLLGIGFVIPDGYIVIDFDDCIKDNIINNQTSTLINKFDSYTEKSPSGTGIHIIVKSSLNCKKWTENIDNQSIEYITSGNFVTFTGDVVLDNDIRTVNIEKPVLCASRKIEPVGGVCDIKKPARYGKVALDGECQKVMAAKTGSRTNTLLRASSKIGQLIVSGYVNEEEAIRELSIAGISTGLSKSKVERTVEAGIAYGKQNPR